MSAQAIRAALEAVRSPEDLDGAEAVAQALPDHPRTTWLKRHITRFRDPSKLARWKGTLRFGK